MYRYPLLGVLAVCLAALAGCSKGSKVEGTVIYKGQPLEGAMVQFIGDDGGVVGTGLTDASGKFTLKNMQGKEVTSHGTFKVLVEKKEGAGLSPDKTSAPGKDLMAEAGKIMEKMSKNPPKSLIPVDFSSTTTSKLTATVPGKIEINLGDK